jgi:twitching motility protein PilJ
VARQSLEAAESGLTAVQNTIGGMNDDPRPDPGNRQAHQAAGRVVAGDRRDHRADLRHHRADQRAGAQRRHPGGVAGEAGRGFSVVAEEVQRLAERSGDATRQIAAIVKTIQTDTQDAVAAMERSTQGVVEGARLSDAAGTALADIDRVTRQLSDLIAQISEQASREAESANVVAANIQHIFAVTEQTGEGTRSTASRWCASCRALPKN